ncbi:MAG: DUF1501 domain-containing protein [Planctomycetaceae bacterium]|nr:DUF1501 domain-containing protein [Planctomycetaceae bacterium]
MNHNLHEIMKNSGVGRRQFLHAASVAGLAAGTLGFRDMISLQAAELRKQKKAVIVLWMSGAPSQMETFDPKPNHENGGETKAIQTNVPGIDIAAGWEQTAKVMDHFSVIRSMNHKEGNHRRATYKLHTGYVPAGSVKHPSLGSNIVSQVGDKSLEIPSIVTIGRANGAGAGFLGVNYEPFTVTNPGVIPDNSSPLVSTQRYDKRLDLLGKLQQDFSERGGSAVVNTQNAIYGKASRMVKSPTLQAFNIESESDSLKASYGDTQFGKGCLLARRLVEHGASYIEVVSNGWDTHTDNFNRVTTLANQVDPAMATLITDLEQRGMLDDTLVIWMGEFGRTAKLNARGGRDHYPRVFNAMLAGGGVKGGQVIGSSTADGAAIKDRPVAVEDLFQSICHSIKVNPNHENISPLGRPMKIVDGGEVIQELFA